MSSDHQAWFREKKKLPRNTRLQSAQLTLERASFPRKTSAFLGGNSADSPCFFQKRLFSNRMTRRLYLQSKRNAFSKQYLGRPPCNGLSSTNGGFLQELELKKDLQYNHAFYKATVLTVTQNRNSTLAKATMLISYRQSSRNKVSQKRIFGQTFQGDDRT